LPEQPFAQQCIDGVLPSSKLSGRGERLRELPLDTAAQDEGA